MILRERSGGFIFYFFWAILSSVLEEKGQIGRNRSQCSGDMDCGVLEMGLVL